MDTFFPNTILTYIGIFAPVFGANNFLYFQGFTLAFMLLGESRKCVTNIARVCFFVDRHVASWERFLSQYQWDMSKIQSKVLALIREKMADSLLIYGAYLCWIDTTLVSKVKGKMVGVQKWHDHSGNPDRGEHLIGHHWAIAGLLCTSVLAGKALTLCWPLLANLIPGQSNPFGFVVNPQGIARAMNFWDAVCPLIAQLYQMKAPFINWMLSVHVHVITRMRWDAVGWDDPQPEPPLPPGKKKRGRKPTKPKQGKKWKIAQLLNLFPLQEVTVTIYGKPQTLHIVTKDLWVKDVTTQKVRVVVIKAKKEPIILLSTDLTLSASQIIHIYSLRFSLELGIRDLKQHFGFTDYQCTSFSAMTRFVGLSLVSFCLWRLTLLTDMSAQWLQLQEKTSSLSFTRVSRALRRFVMQKVFQSSASSADLQKSSATPEEIIRLIT
jgi:hypothetical protein